MPEPASSRSATQGLATIALLKVNFDAGQDHIEMFQPFILDVVSNLDSDDFALEQFRSELLRRHQLQIPANTLHTLLKRATKRGFLRREAGRYFRQAEPGISTDIREARLRIEERQRVLAEALRNFSRERHLVIATADDALGMILTFLERHHVSLALAQSPESAGAADSDEGPSERGTLLVADFLQHVLTVDTKLSDIVQQLLEGYVLQNALFLKDISTSKRRFRDLEVFLDTGLLLGALGFHGEAQEIATKEALSLLRETGASLSVFECTIEEIRGILAVHEERLGSSAGRLSLYPSEVTRFFLTKRYSPSDVREASALVRRNLLGLGVNIRVLPTRRAQFTLDEADLSMRLADRPGRENDPRVIHDVNCVAGVLTLRAGKRSDSLDNARAVFATTSGLTVKNVAQWFETQNEPGVPPIIHHLALSNLAWLKRPASAAKLKLYELVALCAAALHPSRKKWEAFLGYLRRLQESNELSSDEVTAILATELTDRALIEESSDDDMDADSLSEVIDRVKATYRADADVALAGANSRALRSEQNEIQLRLNIDRRARTMAKAISWLLAIVFAVVFLIGLALTIPGVWKVEDRGLLEWVAVGAFALATVMSVVWGSYIGGWRASFEERLVRQVKHWMVGES